MSVTRAAIVIAALILGLAVQAAMTDVRGADKSMSGKPAKGVKADAFGKKNWKPVPPMKKMVKKSAPMVAPAVAPPPPPSAPPLPFVYVGRMVDGEVITVFLSHQQRNHAVKVGDTIDNVYRVDKIADSTLTLTYIPMNLQQQMSLGGPK